MNPALGLAVTLRVRMSASDAYQSNGTVSPARILDLLTDVTTELMIRLDGDEGSLRGLQQVEMLAPVFVGDFVEATGVITKIGNTTRQVALEARKVVTYARGDELALTAADALPSPTLVCRALGTAVVPRSQQRRPRLVLPALAPRREPNSRLPQGSVLVTPPPNVVLTPPRQTPPEVMIAASIMGGGVTRDHSPHVPTTPEEAAKEAKRCMDFGASIVCLGIDDVTVDTAFLTARMTDIVSAIRAETDMVIIVSAVGPGPADVGRRLAFAGCGADIVAMATGSFNFGETVVETPRGLVREVALALRDQGVPSMAEAYELGHFEEAMALGREKLVGSPLRFQFVFGVPGALGAQDHMLQFVSERVPRSAVWFSAGVGRHQRRVTETALRLGGHVRLGLADNIFMRRGVLAEGTAPFIERSAAFALSIGRQPVTPERAKVLLGLVSKSESRDASANLAESDPTPEGASDIALEEPAVAVASGTDDGPVQGNAGDSED